ncbi:MAG TPA: M20 family metallopeptidase [Bacteroidia bacterium]|jgi:amidohydrolase|uniref:M20 metallopeptidase family protein n=1 Tax=Candidatus Pollutiaquabacter sp. TaxID=3416354 RepID=UPI001A3BFD4D|nr:amidohydrolase [Bacteroidota bacterium]MBL7949678.1 amidohydrolase [Bacteroidia bacterium]HRS39456.1 M20 family metallopeptidase [Bacteroidia bacterium]HRU61508.1 M20 family metallopeptidase [Bacteroidia bacterium]
MSLLEPIRNLARKYHGDIIACRRHLHQHPELSFHEFETQRFVETRLTEFGITDFKRMANTGVVALLKGKNADKRTVALRADLDALPIVEANAVDYKSKNEGVMHACGHDVHTASLLGVARILHELRDRFEGTVKLIFQPGEEKLPGGASLMIKEGVLENPKPASVIGQHVMPQIPAGKVGFRKGLYMASTDELYVTVHGKGGHGAMPHLNIDPVMITAQILVALQQIVSRFAKPSLPTVLSFGKVIANGATNVIPDKVCLEGTFRTLNEEWRDEAHRRMKHMAEQIAESMGGRCEFEIRRGYPFLVNDEDLTDRSRRWAEEYVGKENVEDLEIWMAAEDFAFYSQQAKACFYRLGVRNEAKGITSSVHTPTFDIDESALETGMGLMAWLAIRELEQT